MNYKIFFLIIVSSFPSQSAICLDHSSRHWLYYMAKQSPHFTLNNEISANLPYFKAMLEAHIKKLETKIVAQDIVQKEKFKKKSLWLGYTFLSIISCVYGLNAMTDEKYNGIFTIIGPLAFPNSIALMVVLYPQIKKCIYYKVNLQKKLSRDKYILSLLEESAA